MSTSSSASNASEPRYQLGPVPSGTFDTIELAEQYLKDHAFEHGWMYKRTEQPPECRRKPSGGPYPHYITYDCNKSRKEEEVLDRDRNTHESKQRRGGGTKRTACKFSVQLKRDVMRNLKLFDRNDYSWSFGEVILRKQVHNHRPHIHPTAEPRHRISHATPDVIRQIIDGYLNGNSASTILSLLRRQNPQICLIKKDLDNIARRQREVALGNRTPIQWLLEVS